MTQSCPVGVLPIPPRGGAGRASRFSGAFSFLVQLDKSLHQRVKLLDDHVPLAFSQRNVQEDSGPESR